MRQTRKLQAARLAVLMLPHGTRKDIRIYTGTAQSVYDGLENAGYYWDQKSGEWKKADENDRARGKFSGSIFADSDDLPTGVIRLRVMTHEQEGATINTAICEALRRAGFTIIEVSDKVYPNRRGQGVRVYMTLTAPKDGK